MESIWKENLNKKLKQIWKGIQKGIDGLWRLGEVWIGMELEMEEDLNESKNELEMNFGMSMWRNLE
jgi:hypothetical protein